jgi:membrane protease YdiL (CAAX protease family)
MSFWLRIIVYVVVCFGCLFFSSIPLVIAYPEFTNSNYDELRTNEGYLSISQFCFACGIGLGTFIMVTQIESRKLNDYYLNLDFTSLLKGFLLGFAVMAMLVITVILTGALSFSYAGLSTHLISSFGLYFLVAIAEEVLMRGYILNNLKERFNAPIALLVSSLLFGVMHYGNDHFTWIGFATISLSGFLMGQVALKSKSISAAIGLHWSWNFFQGPIAGFAVSGHPEAGVLTPKRISSEIITGGDFGAEGSLFLAALTIVFVVLVDRFYKKKPSIDIRAIQ